MPEYAAFFYTIGEKSGLELGALTERLLGCGRLSAVKRGQKPPRLYSLARTYPNLCMELQFTDPGTWAQRVSDWRDSRHQVLVYFDNDSEGAAPRDAQRPIHLLAGPAGEKTRPPGASMIANVC
jgi:hypothetical protein